MAHPNMSTLTPPEVAFLCEMELITVIPRQRLSSIELMGGRTSQLRPPQRANLPLWLALLLARQHRADIVAPPWLTVIALTSILERESSERQVTTFTAAPPLPEPTLSPFPEGALLSADDKYQSSPPFVQTCVATGQINANPELSLPFHALPIAHMLLNAVPQSIADAEQVRRLVRDLEEVRAAKMRARIPALDGGAGLQLNGVGSLDISESRNFMLGVVDHLRSLGASREASGREASVGRVGRGDEEDEDDEVML